MTNKSIGKTIIGKTILVIEDELPLAEAIKTKLENNGFAVVIARTVKQAFDYLRDLEHIDAIWLDHYLLGKEDGLDFVVKMKAHDGIWNKIPIFVVSNTASPDEVQKYVHLGITKYYVKAEHRLDEMIGEIKSFIDHPQE